MKVSSELDRTLNKAKMNVLIRANSVFISTILFSLVFRWSDRLPTAGTNGKELVINPEFWESLEDDERVFLLLHEAWHVAFEHMLRLKERDMKLWNMACDYVINAILINQRLPMPEGGLYDPQYEGMASEEVYEHLIQNPPDESEAESFVCDLEDPGDEDADAFEEEIKDLLVRASVRSKMANEEPGTIPAEIQRWIDDILNPRLPWNVILENFMKTTQPDDYSMRRVNRRFLPEYYLPTLFSEGLDQVAIAVDTSGSVTDEQLSAFLSETYSIVGSLSPKRTTLIDFDYLIHQVVDIESVEQLLSFKFKGGGGTDLTEVCNWTNEHRPDVLIVFTDGYFHTEHLTDPKLPIIWAIHSNQTDWEAPFGQKVTYPI